MHIRTLSTGTFAVALAASAVIGAPVASAADAASADDIVINEVESNGDPVGDWVELANVNADADLDISGWSIEDDSDDNDAIVFPEGTTIESGGYFSVVTDSDPDVFGIGGDDTITLRDADRAVVDSTTWDGHSPTTWGRVPDMTGEFAVTGESTRDGANAAAEPVDPVETSPWPFDPQTIESAGLGGDFAGEDMSGVDIADDGTAYVVNNGTGTLYVLEYDEAAGSYSIARTLVLKYPDGGGLPDSEGVTVGPDGAVYVATERNNDVDGSRPSVLRYELPADTTTGTISATDEYNLSELTGPLGDNGGLEAIEYLPGAWGGAFAVGVEQTGIVHFVLLGDNGAVSEVQRYDSPFQGVMALDHDATTGVLRVLCDEVCEGRSLEMTFDGDEFVTDGTLYARPDGMDNVANEGFATHRTSVACEVGGTADQVRALWTDDGHSDGVGLRTAVSTDECSGGVGGSLPAGSTGSLGSPGDGATRDGAFSSLAMVGLELGGGVDLTPLPSL